MVYKNKIRSIRISDEMMQLIERQPGYNFTDKWETLVTKCSWELPQKEEELRQIQKRIDAEKERLAKYSSLLTYFETVEKMCIQARALVGECISRMEDYAGQGGGEDL